MTSFSLPCGLASNLGSLSGRRDFNEGCFPQRHRRERDAEMGRLVRAAATRTRKLDTLALNEHVEWQRNAALCARQRRPCSWWLGSVGWEDGGIWIYILAWLTSTVQFLRTPLAPHSFQQIEFVYPISRNDISLVAIFSSSIRWHFSRLGRAARGNHCPPHPRSTYG